MLQEINTFGYFIFDGWFLHVPTDREPHSMGARILNGLTRTLPGESGKDQPGIQLKVPCPRVILFDDPFQIGFGGVLANGTPQVRLKEATDHPIRSSQKRGQRGSL